MPPTCCRWFLLLLLCRGANSGPVDSGLEGPFLLPGELGRILAAFGYNHKLRAIQSTGGGVPESDYGEEEERDEEENEMEDQELGLRAGGSWSTAQWQGRRTNAHLQGKRAGKGGAKFALSLDVPTNILSILIDHAKANDTRSKAAHNAKLMARIGRRK